MECAYRELAKMRWAILSIAFLGVFNAVVADDPNAERRLKIIAMPSVYEIGERKAVYCEATNMDPKDMEWIDNKGNVVEFTTIRQNSRVYVEIRINDHKVLVLYILRILEEDEGVWTCRTKDGGLNDTLNVIVGEKAELDEHQTAQGDENDSIKLTCKIKKGIPPPEVSWYKDNELIKASPRGSGPIKYVITNKTKTKEHFLDIKKLNREDEGKYMCKATQKKLHHYVNKDITLEVKYKPVFFNPEIRSQPEGLGAATTLVDVFAVLNRQKCIKCIAFAKPPAKFKWHKRKNSFDSLINQENVIQGDSSSSLILNMATEEDQGQYKCTASNVKGKSVAIFHVRLGDAPQPPDHIQFDKEQLNHTYMSFEVTCTNCTLNVEGNYTPSIDNLPVTGYSFAVVPYKQNYVADWDNAEIILVMIEDPQQTKFAVGPVANNTKYHVKVRSENLAGHSDWLEDPFIDEDHLPYTKFGVRLASSITTVLLLVSAFYLTVCY